MEKYSIPTGEALEVYQVKGAFDKCVDELKAEGLELITARQLAEARMLGGASHPVSTNWSWVAESVNYICGDILIAPKEFNPLLQYPSFAKQATDCHRNGKEFFLDDYVVGYLLEGAKNGKVLHLERKDVPDKIPTGAFGKKPFKRITDFLFRDKAEKYGQFLKANAIKNVPLYVVDEAYAQKQGKAFSRALWASNLVLCVDSPIGGGNDLGRLGRAFGVRERSATKDQARRAKALNA